jgi:hypothetical protein
MRVIVFWTSLWITKRGRMGGRGVAVLCTWFGALMGSRRASPGRGIAPVYICVYWRISRSRALAAWMDG